MNPSIEYHHPKPIQILGGTPAMKSKKGKKGCGYCKAGNCDLHKSLDDLFGIEKGRRIIRTAAGARKYGKPIGSVIGGHIPDKIERNNTPGGEYGEAGRSRPKSSMRTDLGRMPTPKEYTDLKDLSNSQYDHYTESRDAGASHAGAMAGLSRKKKAGPQQMVRNVRGSS